MTNNLIKTIFLVGTFVSIFPAYVNAAPNLLDYLKDVRLFERLDERGEWRLEEEVLIYECENCVGDVMAIIEAIPVIHKDAFRMLDRLHLSRYRTICAELARRGDRCVKSEKIFWRRLISGYRTVLEIGDKTITESWFRHAGYPFDGLVLLRVTLHGEPSLDPDVADIGLFEVLLIRLTPWY